MEGDKKDLVEEKSSVVEMSHQETLDYVQKTLTELVKNDPLLCHLPTPLTLDEINSQIALEHGQAITVNVVKADGAVMPIVVPQDATVMHLKRAIRRYVQLKQSRQKGTTFISWRYVWKTYWLYFESNKLRDDRVQLHMYGIKNNDNITFIKRIREKCP